jgi:FkbM family methyltransferase
VGAHVGEEVELFFNNGISYAALIEPLDKPFEILKLLCASKPGFIPVQALCGQTDGEIVDYFVSSNYGASSSILRPARHLTDFSEIKFENPVKMRTFTIDSIFLALQKSRPDVANSIDLLFMDVQGAELRVLKGAYKILKKVNVIYTEVGLGGGYAGDVAVSDLINFLRDYSFDIYELQIDPSGWGNAVFFKRKPGLI